MVDEQIRAKAAVIVAWNVTGETRGFGYSAFTEPQLLAHRQEREADGLMSQYARPMFAFWPSAPSTLATA